MTSRVGRSASRPKKARASARSAARSRPEIIGRIGRPTYSACGSGVSGKLTATRRAIRAPALLARPGSGVLLVDDERHLAAPGGEVGRHRDVAAVADDHVGPDPVEHREGLLDRAAQPARDLAAGRPLGWRGSGTGGISSSG